MVPERASVGARGLDAALEGMHPWEGDTLLAENLVVLAACRSPGHSWHHTPGAGLGGVAACSFGRDLAFLGEGA